jgi:hypothetical protein
MVAVLCRHLCLVEPARKPAVADCKSLLSKLALADVAVVFACGLPEGLILWVGIRNPFQISGAFQHESSM